MTPSYNQGKFIEEAIRSVLLQRYPNLEYIVMDGGSTDETVSIIKKYESRIDHWVSGPDKGQSSAINEGFRKASGTIFGWLNSDDLLVSGALDKVANYWRDHPECCFLAGDSEYVSADANASEFYIKSRAYPFKELLQFYSDKILPQPSVFFDARAFKEVGGIDPGLRYALDLDLWLKLSRIYPLHYIPEKLSMLRIHPKSKTIFEGEFFMNELTEVILKYSGTEGLLFRLLVQSGLRRWRASIFCRKALTEYFGGNCPQSMVLLAKAALSWPAILFSREGAAIVFRLLLPMSVKKVLFRNP